MRLKKQNDLTMKTLQFILLFLLFNSVMGFSQNYDIHFNLNGGVPPFHFSWSTGDTTQDLHNVPTGIYTVAITGSTGCTNNYTYYIGAPGSPWINNVKVIQPSCYGINNGKIILDVTPGTGSISYLWSIGDTTSSVNNLSPGTYTVNVKNSNGTGITQTVTETITYPSALSLSYTSFPQFCYGQNSGIIDLTVTGGTLLYKYLWSNGATSEDLTGLNTATGYSVTVTDARGCIATLSNINLTQPAKLISNPIIKNESCPDAYLDASINLNVSGGTAPYNYLWNDSFLLSSRKNLKPDQYRCTIRDNNNCAIYDTFNITQPAKIISTLTASNVCCFGWNNGSASVIAQGGTGTYTYLWDSLGITSSVATGLTSGIYKVTVTDSNNCQQSDTISVNQPAELQVSLANKSDISCPTCSTGAIYISVNGGVKPYTYSWSNGAKSQNITDLKAGTYTVTVTDANGCIKTLTETIL